MGPVPQQQLQKVQFRDDEAGRRGLMCNKSPTPSVRSNCMLPPYQLCRQLTGPPVVSGDYYCGGVKQGLLSGRRLQKMRIRKHQPRVSNVGGESSSGAQRTDPASQEQSQELALSSRGVRENLGGETTTDDSPTAEQVEEEQHQQQQQRPALVPAAARGIERVDSTPRSAFTWLDKLWHAKGFTELEPYSNLEDFVSSLTKRDERMRGHSEEIVEGGDLSRLVGGVDLDFHLLVRHSSVCSQSSSKHLDVGPRTRAHALEWCDSTHGNERLNFQLQSDASLPANAMDNASTDNLPSSQHQGPEVMERLLTNKEGKQKGEDSRLKPSSYWGQARNTSSWMHRDNLEASEVERSYHGEPSDKRTVFAGTSSKTPLNYEISDVSCQPAVGEAAVLSEQQQRHVVQPGDDPASVVAKSVGTRHGAALQVASIQDPPTESLQRRSSRKRRISSSTVADPRPAPPLSPDHPAQQAKDSLEFSLYTVFLRAGKAGLRAREAMSDIVEQRLAGVEEGAVQSSRRIGKLLRNSPYYMEVGEGKFALCTAVIDSDSIARVDIPPLQEEEEVEEEGEEEESEQSYRSEKESESISTADERQSYEAPAGAVRKKRKRAVTVSEADQTEVVRSKPVRTGRPKKLKYMKQENAENLGNQCNRTDGKGWVCPLLAKPGYQLCDHHLNKLRCKPGSRSKKKKLMKMAAAAAAEAEAAAAAAAVVVEGEASTREEVPHSMDTARHELTTP